MFCFSAECSSALGMQDDSIADSALSASSSWAGDEAYKARLRSSGGWRAYYKAGMWLQVALNSVTNITAIATQGYSTGSCWTKLYRLRGSLDENVWQPCGKVRGIFRGSFPLSSGFPTHQSQCALRQQYARPTDGAPEATCCCHGDVE